MVTTSQYPRCTDTRKGDGRRGRLRSAGNRSWLSLVRPAVMHATFELLLFTVAVVLGVIYIEEGRERDKEERQSDGFPMEPAAGGAPSLVREPQGD